MSQETSPIVDSLTSRFEATASNPFYLHIPFSKNTGSISELAQSYFPSHAVATSSALRITVAGKIGNVFRAAAQDEESLCKVFSDSLKLLPDDDSAASLVSNLVKGHLTRNILQRWRVRSETGQQIAAGTYLGTPIHDAKLGKILADEINRAYKDTNLEAPSAAALNRLCDKWGLAQALIRKSIIINSWKSLKIALQPPSMAFDAFSMALEPNTTAKELIERFNISSSAQPEGSGFSQWDSLSLFLADAESISDRSLPRTLHSLMFKVEKTLSDPEQNFTTNLLEQIRRHGQREWLDALVNANDETCLNYLTAIWPVAQATPRLGIFETGVFKSLIISIKQAHRFSTDYLKYPAIERINILTPPKESSDRLYKSELIPDESIASELRSLADLPIAPLISSFTFDAADRDDRGYQCLVAFCELVKALQTNSTWRTPRQPQQIKLLCHHFHPNIENWLAQLVDKYRLLDHGKIHVYENNTAGLYSCRAVIHPIKRSAIFTPD
jgi:hypothetical protein